MGLIRLGDPKVRSYRCNGHTYYDVDCHDVDCRKRGWNGPPRLSFSDTAAALAKARHIASTVRDPVLHYLHQLVARSGGGHSVSEAALRWAEYVRTDTKKRNRPRTIQEIGAYAIQFGHMFPDTPLTRLDRRTVHRVIVGLIQKNGEPVTSQTRRNVLAKLKQFLNSCVSQELVSSNPAQTLSVSVVCRVPEVYTLDEVHRLLKVVQREPHRSLISYVTLGLFTGLRPTEAQRLTWNDFHWDHSVLSISPDRTKVKRARLVELQSVHLDWLNRVPRDQPLIPVGFPRRLKSYQRTLQIRWIPDGFRHSFATYWLGVHQDRNWLAQLMGNSPTIIGRHYLKPVSRSEAQRFWLMHPPTL